MRVFGRYLAFQTPELGLVCLVLLALVQYEQVSEGLAWGLGGLWVVKELVMFPFVRRAYEPHEIHPVDVMIGKPGTVTRALEPRGTVRVGAELWNARPIDPEGYVAAGTAVRIRDVERLTLIVEPAESQG